MKIKLLFSILFLVIGLLLVYPAVLVFNFEYCLIDAPGVAVTHQGATIYGFFVPDTSDKLMLMLMVMVIVGAGALKAAHLLYVHQNKTLSSY